MRYLFQTFVVFSKYLNFNVYAISGIIFHLVLGMVLGIRWYLMLYWNSNATPKYFCRIVHLFWNICVQGFKIPGTCTYIPADFAPPFSSSKMWLYTGLHSRKSLREICISFGLWFWLQNKYLYCRWQKRSRIFLRLNRQKIENYSLTDLELWFLS